MLKLRDIINKLKSISDAHPNINYFGVGKQSDLIDDVYSYPYLWIDTETTHTVDYTEDNGYRSISYEFILRVGDKVNDQQKGYDGIRGIGTTNELDVLSDTFSTLLDIINTISEDSLGLFPESVLIDDISIESFFNEDDGNVTGNQATLIFKVKNDKICITPFNI